MEKRRRERINRSLEELKRLVLEAQNRDVSIESHISHKIQRNPKASVKKIIQNVRLDHALQRKAKLRGLIHRLKS